jgi:crotonobetainyl-CoA:carnitine CoA-transferase CaiB-like acyl-CoA transferase
MPEIRSTCPVWRRAAAIYPRLGQDTQRVLSELLDLKPDEIDRLRDGGSFG